MYYEAYLDRFDEIQKFYECVEKLIDSYFKGDPIDVFYFGDKE